MQTTYGGEEEATKINMVITRSNPLKRATSGAQRESQRAT